MTYLNKFKVKHSKMDNLTYKKLAIQPYLTSAKIYPQLAKDIFKWRTRMAKFKVNFRNGSDNIKCPLGCQHDDSQQNILKCDDNHMNGLQYFRKKLWLAENNFDNFGRKKYWQKKILFKTFGLLFKRKNMIDRFFL